MNSHNIVRFAIALLILCAISSSVLWPLASARPLQALTTPLMDANRNKIFDRLESEMRKKTNNQPIRVIATFREHPSTQTLSSLQNQLGTFKIRSMWAVVPSIAMDLTVSQIWALAQLDSLVQIEYDEAVHSFLSSATYWFGVQKARADFALEGDHDGYPTVYTTDDIVITIIDTGIDPNHVDLDGGKIIGWKDFVNEYATPYDDHGHGTHVASIAAGTGEGNSGCEGVAPGAALVGVKVLNSSGMGEISTAIDGINWAVDNKATYGIEILSLSFGTGGSSDGTDALSQACNNATDQGLIVTVAAGNRGPGAYTTGSPAAAAKVITVGAMADVGHDGFYLVPFSSRGPTADWRVKPDVVAPGYRIVAAKAGSVDQYIEYSGTSMATPFVAGTAALMLDANPTLAPAQMKGMISTTSKPFGAGSSYHVSNRPNIDYGWGRLDSYEAVKSSGNFTGTNIEVPNHYHAKETFPGDGYYDVWTISVTSTEDPIAIALVISHGYPSINIDIELKIGSYVLAVSDGDMTRQETIAESITETGQYNLWVYCHGGGGKYFIDISGGSGLSLSIDDQRL